MDILTYWIKSFLKKLKDKFSLHVRFLLGIKFDIEITNKKRENSQS